MTHTSVLKSSPKCKVKFLPKRPYFLATRKYIVMSFGIKKIRDKSNKVTVEDVIDKYNDNSIVVISKVSDQ